MSRSRLLALTGALGFATIAGTAAAPAADTPPPQPAARAAALTLQISIPGQGPVRIAALEARAGQASGSGAFSFPGDPRVAVVGESAAAVDARPADGTASARSTARAAGVSLLDGLVSAQEVAVEAVAEANDAGAAAELGTVVRGLVVAGQPIADGTNRVVVIQGVGDLTVGERVDALRDERGQRSFAVALHLRLRNAYRGLPAGTEFVVGYADAAAAVPAAEVEPPATDGAAPAPDATTEQAPQPTLATIPTAPGALPEFAAPGSRDTSATQSPPPGGFTQTPPIDAGVKAGLLSGEYAFPVLGGATFSDDFGAPRATTGFHQGIDLFAPHGTPVLAVHDGVLFRVGWNNLGGRRLWLDDGRGNLFYYAHLSAYSPIAQENAIVKKGQVIGFMGNSGDAEHTPAHLHFEIHPQGQWAVPPFEYVTAWQGQPVTAPAAAAPADDASGTRALAAVDPADDGAAAADPGEALPGADIAQASGLDLAALVEASKGADPVAAVSAQRAPADAASADGSVAGLPG